MNGETRELHTSNTHIFDQSFTHSAWNKGEDVRVTLVLFFVHPDITDDELDMLLALRDKAKLKVLLLSPLILMEMIWHRLFKKAG